MFARFERLIDPFQSHAEGQPPATIARFYWHYFRQVWPIFVALLLVGFFVALIEVQLFRYISMIVDLLAATTPQRIFVDHGWTFAWMVFVIGVARPFFTLLHDLLVHQAIAPNLTNMIRWQSHRHVLRQSLAFFSNDFAGRVASKVVQTGPSLRESLVTAADAFWFVGLYVLSALVLFAEVDGRLLVPIIIWLVFYGFILARMVPKIASASEDISEARSMLTGRITDSYTNMQTVKLFAHAEREDAYAQDALIDHTAKFHIQQRLITTMNTLLTIANSLLIVVTGGLAVYLWSLETITIGAITLVGGLIIRIVNMSGWILWEVTGLFENIGTVQDGMVTIAVPHSVNDAPDAKPLTVTGGAISFDKVRFHYGRKKGALEGVSLTIAPGEKIGLVGPSGAGKSTLITVFLRLYDLESGRISIDGTDISTVTQDSLRAAIGVVTQDTSLLHRSIRDNIKYGCPTASDAQMIAAAQLARAHDFILELTDNRGRKGYDAHVGERGVKLSGGQRQRIAIARVLLKNAPILILDEATSALDSDVEAAIQDNLGVLMEGKTVIAIAHRLSTIARMDRLVVMDHGKIIETGTHADLIARGGLYAGLWSRQTGGFIQADEEPGKTETASP